ncbi:MAG: transcriptional repressor [Coprobacillus sp.]
MAETKLRYSKQRETIFDVLKQDYTHPTVDSIYMNVRKIIPDISLGTVYRNLNLLAEQKRIHRLDIGDNVVHYDANIEPHYHMVCHECGCINDLDFDASLIQPLIDKAHELNDDRITSAEILFHGTCHRCLKKES